MDYKEAYEEYKREHPEEFANLDKVFANSRAIEERNERKRKLKLAKIEECKRYLYGE